MGLHQPLKNTAQLAIRVLGVAGVAEDAAVQESAVDVANHRAEVAGSVLLARLAFALLDGGDVVAQRRLPVPAVGLEIKSPVSERHEVISRLPLLPPPALRLIDRVDWLAALGDLHVRLRQDELTDLSLTNPYHHDLGKISAQNPALSRQGPCFDLRRTRAHFCSRLSVIN